MKTEGKTLACLLRRKELRAESPLKSPREITKKELDKVQERLQELKHEKETRKAHRTT